MKEIEYISLANNLLEHISDSIEDIDEEGNFDCELSDGILTIEIPSNRQYVINKHEASQQIWLSSPVSGAHRFSYIDGDKNWISRDEIELYSMMKDELKEFIDITF